jgi:hypothetical protein
MHHTFTCASPINTSTMRYLRLITRTCSTSRPLVLRTGDDFSHADTACAYESLSCSPISSRGALLYIAFALTVASITGLPSQVLITLLALTFRRRATCTCTAVVFVTRRDTCETTTTDAVPARVATSLGPAIICRTTSPAITTCTGSPERSELAPAFQVVDS